MGSGRAKSDLNRYTFGKYKVNKVRAQKLNLELKSEMEQRKKLERDVQSLKSTINQLNERLAS